MQIAAPLIGVLGSLGGVALGYVFNERRTKAQNVIDSKKESTKIILLKGEELYQVLNEWSKYVRSIQLIYLQISYHKVEHSYLHEILEENKGIARVHDRLDTLLSIYFPDLVVQLTEVTNLCASAERAYTAVYKGDREHLAKLVSCGKLIDKKLSHLQASIRNRVKLLASY
jgi:phage tail protein X